MSAGQVHTQMTRTHMWTVQTAGQAASDALEAEWSSDLREPSGEAASTWTGTRVNNRTKRSPTDASAEAGEHSSSTQTGEMPYENPTGRSRIQSYHALKKRTNSAMPPPAAATITVRETLNVLDGPFSAMAIGVAEGRYVLWLGSGISFGRVDSLRNVIARVMEFLRTRVDSGDPNCRFAKALKEALSLAISAGEQAALDLSQPFSSWPLAPTIVDRLVNNYARLLDVEVEGEPSDYLLWEAVDVVGTFGDPSKDPDVEHLCIAVLALEGAATDIASANWDGLVEKSVTLLAGEHAALSISGRPADLQEPQLRARLIKFHGCAIKAGHDERTYRPFLVARKSQIDGWCERLSNAPFVTRLVDLIATRPTLMLGLSAQDGNIQALFTKAAEQLGLLPVSWTPC